MPKHIGIVAVSPEGSSFCYRQLGRKASEIVSPDQRPTITLHNMPFSSYVESLQRGDWSAIAQMLRESAKCLDHAGADFCILPDNVCHHALPMAEAGSPIPWLNMIDLVAKELQAKGCRKIGLIGTRYVTFGSTYQTALGLRGMHLHVPSNDDTEAIDRIIFSEAVFDRVKLESRTMVMKVITELKHRGCEALILGATEAPLLIEGLECPLPVWDPLDVLTDAAIRHAATC